MGTEATAAENATDRTGRRPGSRDSTTTCPRLTFQRVPEAKRGNVRMHLDVQVISKSAIREWLIQSVPVTGRPAGHGRTPPMGRHLGRWCGP